MIWWELTGGRFFEGNNTRGKQWDEGWWGSWTMDMTWSEVNDGWQRKRDVWLCWDFFLFLWRQVVIAEEMSAAFPEWIWVDSALRLAPRRISELAPRLSLFWNGVSKDYLLWCILGRHWSRSCVEKRREQKQLIGKSGRSGIIIL